MIFRRSLTFVLAAIALAVPAAPAFASGAAAGEDETTITELQLNYRPARKHLLVFYRAPTIPGGCLRLQKRLNGKWVPVPLAGIRHVNQLFSISLSVRRLQQVADGHTLRFVGRDPVSSKFPHLSVIVTPAELKQPQRYFDPPWPERA